MKIAIIGTHSTGKTTIAKLLYSTLIMKGQRSIILPEFARECPYPINEETTLQAQAWIQDEQIKHERQHHNKTFLICDRATLDNFAYMQRIANGDNIDYYEHRAARHMGSYDAIFKTRQLDIDAVMDGKRATDPVFRKDIDGRVESLLDRHNVRFYLLPETIDYTVHVNFILDKIENNKPRS